MDTTGIQAAAAAVTGARHLRSARNGQDAAVAWMSATDALVVVCDGCSSGASSEVGARLGATLFARALAARLTAGERPGDPNVWAVVRAEVVRALAELLERMPGDRTDIIREHFLFTVVAAAVAGDDAAVWALGDGAYSFGDYTRVLGPFEDNAPPYLAYDLLGEARPAELAIASPVRGHARGAIVIATDGACDLDHGLEQFLADRYISHPDALRRQLAVLARTGERIDWDARRVVRAPAPLQDDCAVGILQWGAAIAAGGDARSVS